MKILIISPYLPHPKCGHGGGTYLYGLLGTLSKSHEVMLLSFADKRECGLAEDLKKLPIHLHLVPREKGRQEHVLANLSLAALRTFQVARSIALWLPYYVSKFFDRKMARRIAEVTTKERFDVVQIEFAQMGAYVRFVRRGKTIWHDHDLAIRNTYRQYKKAHSHLRKLVMFLEYCKWLAHYRRLVRRFDHVVTLTQQDQRLLQRFTGWRAVSYVPIGVEVPPAPPRYEARERDSLLFIGTFAHLPNFDAAVWLCGEIFPVVLERFPKATLFIIGSQPPPRLHGFAARQPGIKILGFVEDVAPYLQRCAAFIAPLRLGGGVKIKVLHAMAHGIPVVTTKIGAEGIEGIGQNNILIANTAQGLAEHVCRLFRDRELAAMVGRNGYETVKHRYSWDSVLSRLENIYRDLAGQSENKI